MPSYKVVRPCYVPVGDSAKYKTRGQVITLSEEEAKNLDGYIIPLDARLSVRNPDTGIVVRNPDSAPTVRNPDTSATIEQEVIHDVGNPQASDE